MIAVTFPCWAFCQPLPDVWVDSETYILISTQNSWAKENWACTQRSRDYLIHHLQSNPRWGTRNTCSFNFNLLGRRRSQVLMMNSSSGERKDSKETRIRSFSVRVKDTCGKSWRLSIACHSLFPNPMTLFWCLTNVYGPCSLDWQGISIYIYKPLTWGGLYTIVWFCKAYSGIHNAHLVSFRIPRFVNRRLEVLSLSKCLANEWT